MASRNNIIFSRGGVPMSSAEFAARLSTNNVVQQDTVTGLLEVGGAAIDGRPVYTLATMPDPTSVTVGSQIRIPRSEFTYVGGAELTAMPARGIILESNGVTWHTPDRQLYAQQFGTNAAPLVSIPTGTAGTEAAITLPNGNVLFPANFTHLGFKLTIESYWGKGATSGGASSFYTRLGVNSSVLTNSIVQDFSVTTGANKQQAARSFVQFLAADSMTWTDTIENYTLGVTTSGVVGGYMDASITHNYGTTYKLSFSTTPGSGGETNTDLLFGYRVFLEV